MPTYKDGEDVFEIPDAEVGDFLKDKPKAVEIKSFSNGKDTFDIPIHDVEDFLKDNPEAKELKKKELSDPLGIRGKSAKTASLGYSDVSEIPTSKLNSESGSSSGSEIPAMTGKIPAATLSGDAPVQPKLNLPKQSRAQKYQKAFDVNIQLANQAKDQLDQLSQSGQLTPETQSQLTEQFKKSSEMAAYFDQALKGDQKLTALSQQDRNRFVDVGLNQLGSLLSNSAAGLARIYAQAHPEQFGNAKLIEDWNAKKADAQQKKADYYSQVLDENAGYAGKDVTDIYKEKGLGAAVEYSAKKFTESAPLTAYIAGMSLIGLAPVANAQIFGGTAEQKYRENENRADMSENDKLINALGYGTAELLFEGVLTSGVTSLAKDYIKTFGKDAAKKELKKTMFDVVKQGLKKTTPINEMILEGVGEGLTQLSENLIDKYTDPKLKNKNPMDGVIDATAIGSIGGSGFMVGTVGGAIVNQSANKSKLDELEQKKSAIENTIPQVSPQTAEVLSNDVGKIQEQQNDVILKDRK